MKSEFQVTYKKEILRFALLLGEQMLTNGAETSRVEDSVLRVCKSRGFKHVNVFTTPTCVIISDEKFDGLIITGAPVEQMEFEDVAYWDELKGIMDWSKTHVYSTIHICWGAQAALYHHYNIPKYKLDKKLFGVFKHKNNILHDNLTRGLNDIFYAPHSRHTEIKKEDIEKVDDLEILSESEEAGVFIVANKDRRQVFITGHLEYERETLKEEYFRDINKGIQINMPKNYFYQDNPNNMPMVTWRGTASVVFSNWLNYCVYQNTPYDLNNLNNI